MRRIPYHNNRGFTLIETIVVGVLGVIIAGMMYAVFQVNSNVVSRGGLNTKIQMQYETAIMQIGIAARSASYIMAGTSDPFPPTNATVAMTGQTEILMRNIDGAFIGAAGTICGFRVIGTTLQEYKNGTGWQNFRVGPNTVSVTSGSTFSLNDTRTRVTLNISVFASYGSNRDTVASRSEEYACRN